jgi:hypothetical protein
LKFLSAPLDLAVEPLEHVRAVDLHPVLLGEVHEGEHLVLQVERRDATQGTIIRTWLDGQVPPGSIQYGF